MDFNWRPPDDRPMPGRLMRDYEAKSRYETAPPEDRLMVERLMRENEARERELTRKTWLVNEWRKQLQNNRTEYKKLMDDAEELKRELISVKCYAQELEDKLSSTTEDMAAQQIKMNDAEKENENLLEKICRLEMLLDGMENENKNIENQRID